MTELGHYGLEGSTAFVTGASSGLGRHLARTLARAGATVGIAARRAELLDDLAQEISDAGGRAVPLAVDVTDIKAVEQALDQLEEKAGRVSLLVNNAGMVARGAYLDGTPEDYDAVNGLNQRAAWFVQQSVCRRLVAAGEGGAVINIASITGIRPAGAAASYAVSKAAVAHMTRVTALELARHNIRVNAIAPGYFPTDMTDDFLHSDYGADLIRRIPMRRTGELHELDGPLLLLASPRLGSFITGAVLPVDGGHLVATL